MRKYLLSAIGLITVGLSAVNVFAQTNAILPPDFFPGDKAIRLSSGDQQAPEIASGANMTLAVWQDGRALPGSLLISPAIEWETSYDIYAMRLDATGKPLDK